MTTVRSRKSPSRVTTRRRKKSSAASTQAAKAEPVVASVKLSLPRAAALDALHRGGRHVSVEIVGEAMDVGLVWPLPPQGPEDWAIRLQVGATSAVLIAPEAEIGTILANFAPEIRGADFPPEQLAILLEAALEPGIAALETVLDASLQIVSAGVSADAVVPDFGFQVSHSRGTFTCAVCDLETDLVERIATRMADLASPSETVVDLELLLRVCLDAVSLSLADLRSLQTGDVVMMDRADGAFVLIADRIAAPLALETASARLVQTPIPIANSQWNWIMTDMPASTTEPEEGSLDDIPVTVVFELARKAMPVSEIKTLIGGAIVSLPELERETINLVANGKRIGKGEIVRIGEGVGIRILSIGDHA